MEYEIVQRNGLLEPHDFELWIHKGDFCCLVSNGDTKRKALELGLEDLKSICREIELALSSRFPRQVISTKNTKPLNEQKLNHEGPSHSLRLHEARTRVEAPPEPAQPK